MKTEKQQLRICFGKNKAIVMMHDTFIGLMNKTDNDVWVFDPMETLSPSEVKKVLKTFKTILTGGVS